MFIIIIFLITEKSSRASGVELDVYIKESSLYYERNYFMGVLCFSKETY